MANKTRTWKLISAIAFSGAIALGVAGCGGGGGTGSGPVIVDPGPEIPIVPADDHGDSRADATVLPLDGSVAGKIETDGDDDYFSIEVTEPGTLKVYTTGSLDTVGELQASDGSVLATDDDGGTDTNFNIEHSVDPGTYYVNVGGHESATGDYVVLATLGAGVATDDHGNSRADATALALGGSVPGKIDTGYDEDLRRFVVDEDYFRVDVTEPGTLTVYTTGVLIDRGELQAGDGSILARWNNGPFKRYHVDHYVDPGTYYVKVSGHKYVDASGHDVYFTGSYVVHTRFVAGPPDDHGDTRSGATLVPLGGSVPGEIGMIGDVDYFYVNVTEPGTLTVYTTGSLDTFGILEGPNNSGRQDLDNGDGGNQKNFSISWDVVDPGNYYIRVTGWNRETGDYILWARFVASPPDRHGNTRSDATLLPLGGAVRGEIWEEEDEDYFRVEVPRTGQLTVIVDRWNEIVGEMQAADGAHLATLKYLERNRNAVGFSATVDVAPGAYYVRIGTENISRRLDYNLRTNFVGSQPPPTDDHGDTRADATLLPLGGSVPGEIWQGNDEDFFRVEVAQTGTLTVYTTGELDTEGELQSADGTRLASDRFRGDRGNFRIVRPVDPGTYYVEVGAHGGPGRTFGTYVVLAEFGAPQPADDHGDTRADATFLPLGGSVPGEIWQDDDDDFFRIEISQRGTLSVDVESKGVSTSTEVELQAADGTRLADDRFGLVRGLDPGTYFVKVSAYIQNPGSPETYVVHASFDASAPDDHANSRSDATSLALESSVSGVLEATVDEDFFRVEVPQAGWLTVYATGDDNTFGELQSADGTRLAHHDFIVSNFRIERGVGPGTYYVKVGTYIVSPADPQSYTVFAHFFADGAPDDHGNTRSDATSLALGGPLPGAIEEGDDVDFFKVELTAYGELTFHTTGNLDTELTLLSADGTLRFFSSVGRGTYYIKVESQGEARGSYVLHAQFKESSPDDHGSLRANATNLVLGGSVSGVLEHTRDEDFFRVEVTQSGSLTVYSTGDANPFGELQDPDGTLLAHDRNSDSGSNFRIVEIVDPGPHYIKVSGGRSSQGSYVVHTNFVAGPADDHGNSRFDATALPLEGSVAGVIEERDDGDYFRVEVTEPGTLEVYTTGSDDPSGILQASDGSFLSSNDDGGEGRNFRIVSFVASATYYIRVGGAPGSYVVHASFVAQAPDDHGDSRADATVLALGSSVPGGIQYGGDSDYFSVEVTEPGSLTVYTSESLNTVGELQTADGSVLASYTGIPNWRLWRYVAPATYYIRVGGSNTGRPGSYVVHADFVAQAPDIHGDFRADATVLALGSSVPGGIQYVHDSDFFSVEVTEPGSLTVYTSGSLDTVGQLQTASGFVLAGNDDGGDRRNFRIGRHVAPATYYIRVRGSDPGSYVVHAEFVADAPVLPPDHPDTRAGATRIASGETVRGDFHSSEDVDWFRLEITEPSAVDIQLFAAPGAEISVLDLDGNVLASSVARSTANTLSGGLTRSAGVEPRVGPGALVLVNLFLHLSRPVLIRLSAGVLVSAGARYVLLPATALVVARILFQPPKITVKAGGSLSENLEEYRRCILQRLDNNEERDVTAHCEFEFETVVDYEISVDGIIVGTVTIRDNQLLVDTSCEANRAERTVSVEAKIAGFDIPNFNLERPVTEIVPIPVNIGQADEKNCRPERKPGGPELSVSASPGESVPITLDDYIRDPRKGSLRFAPKSVPSAVSIADNGSNWTIRISPDAEYGETSMAITATSTKNGTDLSADFTFRVIVDEEELGPEWIRAENVDCHAHRDTLRNLGIRSAVGAEAVPYTYSGECRERKAHGQGIATLSTPGVGDARYSGEWRDGRATGQGIWNRPDGHRYEGEFLDGYRHGQGTGIWADGARYEGAWHEGLQHGQGTYEWSNGDRYTGGFHNGAPWGHGTLIETTGSRFNGAWENGRLCDGFECTTAGTVFVYRFCAAQNFYHGSCPFE